MSLNIKGFILGVREVKEVREVKADSLVNHPP
jgi:hypothetical protein